MTDLSEIDSICYNWRRVEQLDASLNSNAKTIPL